MIGIFGTILGFYFGSLNPSGGTNAGVMSLANVGASSATVAPGDKDTISAAVVGGKPPLKFDLTFDEPSSVTGGGLKDQAITDNKISVPVAIPANVSTTQLNYTLVVRDSNGFETRSTGVLTIVPKTPSQ